MSDADRTAIARASARLVEAVNGSDVAGVLAVWADDGVMMPPGKPAVRGRQAIEEFFRRLFSYSRVHYQFTASEIQVVGDIASERITFVAEAWDGASQSTRSRGKGLHLFRRASGGAWTLAADLWNSESDGVRS
jgi:uncharacterized protein (TIGR02246 family)